MVMPSSLLNPELAVVLRRDALGDLADELK